MSTSQTISWIQPTIESQTISANVMKMDVNFHDGAKCGDVTITRISNGWIYNDAGNFERMFKDAEFLCYEFEYPKSLQGQLEAMPIGEGEFKPFMNWDAMNDTAVVNSPDGPVNVSLESLIKLMEEREKANRGSNMTPKKKKRKKRK